MIIDESQTQQEEEELKADIRILSSIGEIGEEAELSTSHKHRLNAEREIYIYEPE